MAIALLGLGANLGDRRGALERAVERLRSAPDVAVLAVSRWRETAAVGGPPGQPAFLNGAVRLETSLPPLALLALLRAIEREAGRERGVRWDARPLDLDLLLYDDLSLATPELELPHPRMAFRRFVLEPAAEVAGDLRHPATEWTVRELLERLDAAVNYVAVTGTAQPAQATLAGRIAAHCGGRALTCPPRLGVHSEGAVGGDSTGPGPAGAIEFLDPWRKLLSPATFADGRLVVSDFWFGELPAAAEGVLRPAEYLAFEERWRQAGGEVVAPKLIVAVGMSSAGSADAEASDPFRQALRERLRQPRQGPVLEVPAEDLELATAEATAAVLAMR